MQFYPLDALHPNSSQIKPDKLQQIYEFTQNKAKLIIGNLDPSQDLIQFDPKYTPVMRLLFQDWFLCDDEQTADRVSSKKNGQLGYNCITLKGDKY